MPLLPAGTRAECRIVTERQPPDGTVEIPHRLREVMRSDLRVVARSLITLVSRVVSKFAIVVFLVVAARLLTTEQFGVYSYVLVLAQTFGILSDPQVALVAGRDVSTGRRTVGDAFWSVLPVVVLAGVGAAFAMTAFGLLVPADGVSLGDLAMGGAFIVCNRLLELGATMLRSTGRFELEATIQTVGTTALVVVAVLMAAAGHGVALILAAFCAQALLGGALCAWCLRRDLGRPRRGGAAWRPLVRVGIRLSIAASAAAAATRAPLIVLGVVGTSAQVAGLSAAVRLSDAAYLLALTAGQALLPSLASMAAVDARRTKVLAFRIIGTGFVVGILLATVMAPFGSAIMGAVFGPRYERFGDVFVATTVSLPFMGMFWISWFGLFAFGAERVVARASVFGAVVSVAVGLVAIPLGGATAAAWVYAGAVALLATTTFACLLRLRLPVPTGDTA